MSRDPAGVAVVDAELVALLRRLKLGRTLDTLPERLTLARTQALPHAEFLTLVLADEVARRDAASADLRARAARLDPAMRLDTFDPDAGARLDRAVWHELTSLRFLDEARGVIILGPVGVGKTHLACALGHIAVRPGAPSRSTAPTNCSAPSKRPGWTTRWRPSCDDWPASNCSSSTTSRCQPWTKPRPPTSTSSSWNATSGPRPCSPPTATRPSGWP